MRLATLILALVAAGCAGPSPLPTGPDAPVSARAVAATADSLATGDRAAALGRALARAGITPFGDYSLRTESPQFVVGTPPMLGGYIPGEHPVGRPELVVVAVSMASDAVPAVVEAMRVVVERSHWGGTPDRTVLVAFWTGARGSDGLRQPLSAGLWPRALVRSLVTVGTAPDSLAGLPVVSVPDADGPALAVALVDAITRTARYTAPPDTLSTR
ncbi:hypothetical protein [Rubrivirga sp. IMCC43871]|uniref:hypothetical protein n=1 Tax=Rubrivirga sp. IMCC43871 TaxID=3391575 RepID=UPI0039900E59